MKKINFYFFLTILAIIACVIFWAWLGLTLVKLFTSEPLPPVSYEKAVFLAQARNPALQKEDYNLIISDCFVKANSFQREFFLDSLTNSTLPKGETKLVLQKLESQIKTYQRQLSELQELRKEIRALRLALMNPIEQIRANPYNLFLKGY